MNERRISTPKPLHNVADLPYSHLALLSWIPTLRTHDGGYCLLSPQDTASYEAQLISANSCPNTISAVCRGGESVGVLHLSRNSLSPNSYSDGSRMEQ